jgi:hypothetical protein
VQDFSKLDDKFHKDFEALVKVAGKVLRRLLKTGRIKSWMPAWFAMRGLENEKLTLSQLPPSILSKICG